jgi:hypothetical protein
MSRRSEISLLVTDESIGFYQYVNVANKSKSGYIDLEKGIVEYGYIKDPSNFLNKVKTLFKRYQIKPNHIELVVHDQNLLIREIQIPKDILLKKSIDQYLSEQQDKAVHFPFEKPTFSHYIKSENEQSLSVLVLVADESLLQDYHDVFDRMGVKEVSFDLSSLSLYQLYVAQTKNQLKNAMLVSIYAKMMTIQIVDHQLPIFSMNEEIDAPMEEYGEIVENYVERIANYYKYSLNKNKESLSSVLIFNFSDQMDMPFLSNNLTPRLKHLNASVFDLTIVDGLKTLPHECHVAYACSVNNEIKDFKLKFKLDRVKKINLYSSYVLVLSFAIFTFMALVFVPYALGREDINVQLNINNILENQLEILIRDLPSQQQFSQIEKDYSNVYDDLSDSEVLDTTIISDLLSKLNGNLELSSYQLSNQEQRIVLVITGLTETDLNEYLIQIYENYGIISGSPDTSRWMVSAPIRRSLSTLVMEVTVYYA